MRPLSAAHVLGLIFLGAGFGLLAQISAYGHSAVALVGQQLFLWAWSWAWLGVAAAIPFGTGRGRFLASSACLQAAVAAYYVYRAFFEPFYLSLPVGSRGPVVARLASLAANEWGFWAAGALLWALLSALLATLWQRGGIARALLVTAGAAFTCYVLLRMDEGAAPTVAHSSRIVIMAVTVLFTIAVWVHGLRRRRGSG